ncbi:hypothetical protein FisN_16Hh127 [Fistulifera solaris]|uniref:AP2/ERF domain-containing protein n=1 Tax=Fistulifera solaris TaxID=1519565 RepID=A0A1Z5KTK5_FISSO|nr:hypothetical protein FisN_16Hh127 [Fistulifera solaris]|eukprot:GAX29432.1 hypothetical protein FisN_16Hh127 [Fistulifera solaris]
MPTATRRSNKYTTPARSEVAAPSSKNEPVANLVTPSDPSIDVAAIRTAVTSSPLANEHGDSKQVRFGPEDVTESPRQQNAGRGLVSRRGGRYASPGNRSVLMKTHSEDSNSVEKDEQATEYEFHSPTLKRDEVPCLSNEQRQDKSSSSSDSSSSFSASAVEANSNQQTENVALRFPKADEATKPVARSVDSPKDENAENLPSLEDLKIMSPGGPLFTAPTTPSKRNESSINSPASFEEERKPEKQSPRERCVQTPTDFAMDYGKHNPMSNGSFDTSNVLAWLQSPTANGLFSPGGYGALLNTPGGPRTPRTPTVSTSFFFSDVASLPRGDTPAAREESASKRKNISSIICISPLSSSKARTGTTPPANLKDMFSSPQEKSKARSLPLLSDDTPREDKRRTSQRSASKDPSLDAVPLAERDLMEDEDMSVLLQLASNTPRSAGGTTTSGPVFRSPTSGKEDRTESENLPALQLPMIGGQNGRKPKRGEEFAPPQLGMRSGSGTKNILPGSSQKENEAGDSQDGSDNKSPTGAYPMHPPYPRDAPAFYPPAPPGMHGPSGSMRVVVGGPPPSGSPPRPGISTSPHQAPPFYDHPYPPPPGMYSQYHHVGYPYQYSHHPPRHMPLYGGHQPPATVGQEPKKGTKKTISKPVKRGPSSPDSKVTKKPRKSPSKTKNKVTPQLEGEDRDKAAASILAVNAASGGKNDKAAALAAAILRGVTMRPSGKWQAQLYFAGKSRYIGVFDSREKAALAYEIAREKLKHGPQEPNGKSTENLVNAARKAAFDGVNEKL